MILISRFFRSYAIDMEHFFENIDGWFNFDQLYSVAVSDSPNPGHFVEIGCWKGKSAAYMAAEIVRSGKQIRFDCVDTWIGSVENAGDQDVEAGTLYETFLRNMAPAAGHYNPLRMTSLEAAKLYEDRSLDFVFIDAAHDYESVMSDILAWYPKVKVGGKLGGHDYDKGPVRGAVHNLLHYKRVITDQVSWCIAKTDDIPLLYMDPMYERR
jgi:SAM-dependent methyltransferase